MAGNCKGMTLVELLGTLAILGLALGMAAMNLAPMEGALAGGASLTEGFLREARSSAMASTSAYRVEPSSSNTLVARTANRCDAATWVLDPDLALELPEDVVFTDTSWSVCFSSRGVADANVTVPIWHPTGGALQVEVLLGGATRVLP